jgi:septal ring factor EnvC (AmiA/AmiB activator)
LDLVAFLVVVVLLGAVVWIISAPLRREREGTGPVDPAAAAEVQRLEAARDAKYREIRDAEMDLRTGKLSTEDHRQLDAGLRGEAVEILRRLDEAREAAEAQKSGQTTS